MAHMKKWAIFGIFLVVFGFSTETLTFEREDGSKAVAYVDLPTQDKTPILFLIAGSQKESALHFHEALKSEILEQGFCPVTLEKRGFTSTGVDEKEFNQFLNLRNRLSDHLLFSSKMKSLLPKWNGKVAILGQGDGGRVGAQFATHLKSIESIALIAAGGAWTPRDELLFSFRSEMANEGFSPQYIHGFLVQAKRELEWALERPKVDQKAFGYSYKYWEALLQSNLSQDLSKLSCPIFSANGELDDRVPIESVELLAKTLGERLTLIRKEKKGREIAQDLSIYSQAISWIADQ
jgi:hypothetical protein